ncbi:MAG: exodeoxyribonuclease VII small subunit [Clostridium sp.]|mgnify:FL=1|jgi:exodeoxyribonuclease VII small subunit|nr:exodeoxyribonuclease VII small subunit [Lachnospiraceae bacterium]MCI5881807.1 exodeoxyribonuclease VII small subunit [Clostridium sp.]CDA67923.1 exodeoxyribonuclease 7 small subunit [Clostridium sp. CAG:510]MDD6179863.1 exodeoxyribonuclease VII small subunit [Clostridium sp.]MED9806699.1 exodeoxyribonuclease VII small subunit [Lachnospiraceae bacterium]
MTLEEKLAKLDAMTEQLRKEDITLEESFSLYKDGMELIKQCNADIDRVEKQVQILNADGQVTDWDEE